MSEQNLQTTQPGRNGNARSQGDGGFGTTSDALGKASREAERAVDSVRTQAVERIEDVRDRAVSGLSEQQDAIAGRIHRVSDVIQQASEELRQEDPTIARYVEVVGRRIEGAASYVRRSDLGMMAHDLRDFAAQRPAWFVGGAFVAGLALGRFLKSSQVGARGPESDRRGFADDRGTAFPTSRAFGEQNRDVVISRTQPTPLVSPNARSGGPEMP